jgi:hypothetical protein
MEWSERVLDLREQFPCLPVDETVAIAAALGIRHPMNAKARKPLALTTDFLITLRGESREVDEAIAVKPSGELQSVRTLQKLEIERRYWLSRNIKWSLVTESEIDRNVAHNLRWLHPYFKVPQIPTLETSGFDKLDTRLRELLADGISLSAAALACDDKLGLPPGSALSAARHFIASRRWVVDLHQKIDPVSPMTILNDTQP